jgi:hypothetical protein
VKGVAKSQERIAAECGVGIRAVKFRRHIWQHCNIVALCLLARQAVTHVPSFLNSTIAMTNVTCERTELLQIAMKVDRTRDCKESRERR